MPLKRDLQWRSVVVDGLGRLTQVFEDPSGFNYETDYAYDAYDALNRISSKSYSDSTPPVKYFYDGNTPSPCSTGVSSYGLAIGRRTAMCDGPGYEAWTYNDVSATGWQVTDKRNTNSVTESTVTQANLAGSPATLTYPSGRIVTYTYNGAARPTAAQDVANGVNYGTSALYAPPGEINSLNLGASVKLTSIFNSRLQPCWIYATTGTSLPSSSVCTSTATAGTVLDLKYDEAL